MYTTLKKFIAPLVMIVAFCTGIAFTQAQGTGTELDGYAWSNNIGWISMNCKTGSPAGGDICGTSNYSVTVGTGGALTGFGWSDNLGWIKFGGLSGMPAGGANAVYNAGTGAITGFARFCSGIQGSQYFSINNNCSGSTRTDGWDGWVSLSGSSPSYGVVAGVGGAFSGYAWGDEVVGWVDFSGVRFLSAGTVFLDVGAIPSGGLTPIYTPANYTTAQINTPPTLTLLDSQNLYYKWNISGSPSCSFSGATTFPLAPTGTGSSLGGLNLNVGTHFLALTCAYPGGSTITTSATIEVVDAGVFLNVDPNSPNTTNTQAELVYYSGGTQPNSCRAYSYKPALASPGPYGNPGIQSATALSAIIPPTQPPQVSDWNSTSTTITYVGGLAGGKKVVQRESVITRYYIECVNKSNGNFIRTSTEVGPLEPASMTLVASKNGIPVTQVNQGDTVDLTYTPVGIGYTFNSCQGRANKFTGGTLGGQVPATGWSSATQGTMTPLTPSSAVPIAPFSTVYGVPSVLSGGETIQYFVECTAPWGAKASATANVDVRATGGLVLNATPSSFLENTSGQTTTLSWSHPTPLIFPAKACHAGDATSPTGLKINGVSANASSWTTAVGSLGSPNSSKPNVQVHSLPAGSVVEYSITCIDISSVSHVAQTNIVYTRPVQAPLQQAISSQCIAPLNQDFEVSWISLPSTNTCYSVPPSNTLIPWANGLPPLGNALGLSGDDSGSFVQPMSIVTPQGYNVTMQCQDANGVLLPGTVSTTIFPDCSVQGGSSGPKKPRFEEF